MKYPQKKAVIYRADGTIKETHITPENNPAEFPPVHLLGEGEEAAMVFDDHDELPTGPGREGHRRFHSTIHYECVVRNGKLVRNGKPMKSLLVPHARVRNGSLERSTVRGWEKDET